MTKEPMTQSDALEILASGHAILTVKGAEKICEVLGVPLSGVLILTWQNAKEAFEHYGFFADEDKPGSGVDGLDLGYAICEQLGIDPPPGQGFTGKGFQARANAQAIKEKLTQA